MLNQELPNFFLPATTGKTFQLSEYQGKNLVLYFYPKDATPGCTSEAQQFRDHYDALQTANTEVFGISRDSLKSHESFKAKFSLPFELLSDTEESACNLFNVIKMKNMYGKQVRGIERSTFLIDASGKLRHEWRGIKVNGHVEAVLAAARTL
jgi:peroxiredoxin Q/BCP